MIKLYGLRMSNYYSLTKALLIEKALDFEEVKKAPSQKEDFLMLSPMGKMPAIEVDGVYLSESIAIAGYLERLQPQPALLPDDAMHAAKVMELVCHLKLDVELVARRLLPEVLFKQPVSEETKVAVKADLAKGMKAVERLFVGAPYAAGDQLTLADFYTFYCFGLSSGMVKAVYDEDLLDGYPAIQNVLALMAEHPSVKRVETEKSAK
ncbi:MAG: glutathione S-transferase family protein [Gammaproteobacteria bacterium]|jgi:glutathione S-transferase|nr:glutathione S-transferase family protein [Gammaproteobacteria bacterium]MBT7540142.1 glutathione S-transferase family protein [Gammaproteobacteria bacterium]MDA7833088.1 glutathione S-transferase family protein [Pseudomonadales bacterium]|tara:strand:+ start:2395 stop:3018 length:624 start_codon:yes stop_codon:yes gene_type:complete